MHQRTNCYVNIASDIIDSYNCLHQTSNYIISPNSIAHQNQEWAMLHYWDFQAVKDDDTDHYLWVQVANRKTNLTRSINHQLKLCHLLNGKYLFQKCFKKQ